jgi:hypothetical protein
MPQYDSIGPTPRNALLGLIADYLGKANGYAQRSDRSMPMGKSNPVLSLLADGVGLGDVAATADRASYGLPLTSGTGQTTQMLPETRNALMAVAPIVAKYPMEAGKVALGFAGGGSDAAMGADKAMMLYHGSPEPLNGGVFDLGKVGSNTGANTEGWGAYHSLEKKNALRFGKNLTKVDIPDDVAADVLLDWQKPLSQQSPNVQRLAERQLSDSIDPTEAARQFWSWNRSINRMDTETKKIADKFAKTIYQDNGIAKMDINEFNKIASEITPRNPKYYSKQILGSGIENGKDLFDVLRNSYAGSQKTAAQVLDAYGINGSIMNADADLFSVVPGSRNVVIHNQDLLDKYTVRGAR